MIKEININLITLVGNALTIALKYNRIEMLQLLLEKKVEPMY